MTNRLENIGSMIRDERLRKGLMIKTVTKALDALDMSASVVLKNEYGKIGPYCYRG